MHEDCLTFLPPIVAGAKRRSDKTARMALVKRLSSDLRIWNVGISMRPAVSTTELDDHRALGIGPRSGVRLGSGPGAIRKYFRRPSTWYANSGLSVVGAWPAAASGASRFNTHWTTDQRQIIGASPELNTMALTSASMYSSTLSAAAFDGCPLRAVWLPTRFERQASRHGRLWVYRRWLPATASSNAIDDGHIRPHWTMGHHWLERTATPACARRRRQPREPEGRAGSARARGSTPSSLSKTDSSPPTPCRNPTSTSF